MRRLLILPLLFAVVACPRDKRHARTDSLPVDTGMKLDTTPTNLGDVPANIGKAVPDTFTPRKLPTTGSAGGEVVPPAPGPLTAAVEREQSMTKFCFQEFGQKADPTLRGNVAMLVTVRAAGITDARVADSKWSSRAGGAVNRCLNERARQAWRLAPGAVQPGRYVVQLTFTGT